MAALIDVDTLHLTVGLVSFSLVLLVVAYPDRYVTTMPRPDLPGPKGFPLLGNLLQVIPWRKRPLVWLKSLHNAYGPVCTFTCPPWGRGILINRPEWLVHVKHADMQCYSRGPIANGIFKEFPGEITPVASEGAQWRLARKSMYPLFTIRSFTEHVSYAMDMVVPKARGLIKAYSDRKQPVDWNEIAGRIALSILTQSAFSVDWDDYLPDTQTSRSNDLRNALMKLNLISARRLLNPFWKWTEYLTGDRFRFNRARSFVRNTVHEIVQARGRGPTAMSDDKSLSCRTDFLDALLQDPTFDDPVLVRDTLVTILFAGRDNTQNTLAWGIHALMGAPEWMNRMRAEAELNRSPTNELMYTDLARYPVHLAVFYEVVRLWPGLPKNGRLALSDDVLPALPEYNLPSVKVERGEYIFWSDYLMMRDENVWGPSAETFDPSRHLDPDGAFTRPGLPRFNGFGAGPRLCPAAQLATYEFVACMAGILPYFDFTPSAAVAASGDRLYKEPVMEESFTASLNGPLWVDVHQRAETITKL